MVKFLFVTKFLPPALSTPEEYCSAEALKYCEPMLATRRRDGSVTGLRRSACEQASLKPQASCSTFSVSQYQGLATTSRSPPRKANSTSLTWISQPFSPHFPELLSFSFAALAPSQRRLALATAIQRNQRKPSAFFSCSPLYLQASSFYSSTTSCGLALSHPLPLSSLPSDASTLSPGKVLVSAGHVDSNLHLPLQWIITFSSMFPCRCTLILLP